MTEARRKPAQTDVADHRNDPRHIVQVAGKYRARARNGGSRDIWIKDISETGCRFFDKFSVLETGTSILFRVGNVGPISAQVRWREKSVVGIRFDQPLYSGVLGHIVETMDLRQTDEA